MQARVEQIALFPLSDKGVFHFVADIYAPEAVTSFFTCNSLIF